MAPAVATTVLRNASGRNAVGRAGGAGVKAEPADIQDGRPGKHHRQVVRFEGLFTEAGTLADQVGTDQPGAGGVDVHHGAAGEVQCAVGGQ